MPESKDPSFRGHTPHQHSLGNRLIVGVSAGAEKTTDEWAEELHTTPGRIRDVLKHLRKKNYLYYPIGTVVGFKPQQGIIVDIRNAKEDVAETMERHNLTYLAPQLESIVRIIEQTVHKFPQLRPLAQSLMNESLAKLKQGELNSHDARLLEREKAIPPYTSKDE